MSDRTLRIFFIAGLLLLPVQSIQLGAAQFAHLWAFVFFALMVFRLEVRVRMIEVYYFAFFLAMAIVLTKFGGYEHIKATEQIIKFGFVYPAFYLIGRMLGERYHDRKLPYGYLFIWIFILVEYAVEYFEIPFLYRPIRFALGAMHGTFKERNWFAVYIFLATYLLFLKSRMQTVDILKFLATSVVVAVLSESKTILVSSAMVLLLQVNGRIIAKASMVIAGIAFYIYQFGGELSGARLRVRLEDERGLAFKAGVKLIEDNWLGYGFGFVESYFSTFWFAVRGLGAGTNALFCAPLDLMVIAGIPGLILWFVFFCGIGVGSVVLLAPVAAWSLLNPLHQSEIVYLFLGFLISRGLLTSAAPQKPKALAAARPPLASGTAR